LRAVDGGLRRDHRRPGSVPENLPSGDIVQTAKGAPDVVCYLDRVPIVEQPQPPQLILSGEIDIASADDLRAAGARALGSLASQDTLAVDLSDVTFIDSSGLGALVSIRNAADAAERSISLRIVSPTIIRLFELTGLRDSFTILPDPL
jgi:anti-sigma B factor antagonist